MALTPSPFASVGAAFDVPMEVQGTDPASGPNGRAGRVNQLAQFIMGTQRRIINEVAAVTTRLTTAEGSITTLTTRTQPSLVFGTYAGQAVGITQANDYLRDLTIVRQTGGWTRTSDTIGLVVPVAGTYVATANVYWRFLGDLGALANAVIKNNAVNVGGGMGLPQTSVGQDLGLGLVTPPFVCAVGDLLSISIWQNAGRSISVLGGGNSWLSAWRISA